MDTRESKRSYSDLNCLNWILKENIDHILWFSYVSMKVTTNIAKFFSWETLVPLVGIVSIV